MAIVQYPPGPTPTFNEPEPKLSPNALAVLEKRYLRRDETGKVIETPGEMFWRVAWNLAQADRLYGASEEEARSSAREFYRLMAATEFLPNSPTLMNAGLDLQQLSACFVLPVEDSLDGIFDALKWQAKIHQSGGGCVSGDAHIYTTFCGVERFGTLYDRVRSLGRSEEAGPGYRVMDVSDLGIRTFAMDPTRGAFAPKQVTHLWRWEVPADKQLRIRSSDGSEVTTSEWHPFYVLTGAGTIERRADALRPGDILFTPNPSLREAWPFSRYLEQDGFVLSERLAWLAGFFLGDGSLDRFKNRATRYEALRLRLFNGRPDSIRFAQGVLADFGVHVAPQRDGRGLWRLTTTDRTFVPRFARVAQVDSRPKVALTLPEWVAKSPLPVIGAFLAGLVDSDGYVSLSRRRLEYTTICPDLARRLVSLLSALGLSPSLHQKLPGAKGKHVEYLVHMADAKRTPELVGLIRGWVHDSFKRDRLTRLTGRVRHNTHPRIPVPFSLLARLLAAAGVETRGTDIHRAAVQIGGERIWLHRAKWGEGIGEDKLRRLVAALRPLVPAEHGLLLDQLENLADGWTTVESIGAAAEPKTFYDMTVVGFNNYLAGGGPGKLAVVHNTGFGFSRLRPKGDFVKSTMGVASGPVSFMKIFDAATQTVKQGGKRRGANMGILRVDHPDILEFITCKDDLTQVTNFNISVAVTDAFMEAVKKDGTYDIVNPRNHEVVKQLKAREVFDKIAFQAWKNGEPGLFFLDTTNKTNPCPHITDFEATNPCVAGDTLVSTEHGLMTIAEVSREYPNGGIRIVTDRRVPAEIVSESNGLLMVSGDQAARGTRLSPIAGAWRSGVKPTWRLVTKSGFELVATEDHKVFTTEGKVAVRDLTPRRHRLLIQSGEGSFPTPRALPFVPTDVYVGRNGRVTTLSLPTEWSRELGWVLGWLVGDGWVRSGDVNCRVGFTFSRTDAPMFATLRRILNEWYGKPVKGVQRGNGVYHLSYHSKHFVDFFLRLGAKPVDAAEKEVPRALFRASRDAVVGFLQALFTADGTIRNHANSNSSSIALSSKSRELLKGVQLLLLSLGIRSRVLNRSRPPRSGLFSYVTKAGTHRTYGSDGVLYELFVFGESRLRFHQEVGFLDEKQARLSTVRHAGFYETKFEDVLVEKTFVGEREVFDLTEPASHSMITNGIAVTQCGEQPLLPFESCNLGSIDLDKHMVQSGGNWDVDWAKLEHSIRTSVHMLDNVIDQNAYPVPQIEEMTKLTRKIGLGVMGFARMLFKLKVAYDSPEGVEWGRRLMQYVKDIGYDESRKLAEVRGPYPAWRGSRHEKMGVKVRNSYVTTVAPTGTLSMIADTSGGCEPEFSLIWYKNVMDGTHLPYVLDHFIQVAKDEGWWREGLLDRILKNGGSARGLAEVPERWQRVFAVSFDVSSEWHVRMQGAFQEGCDAAVSKTINLPASATAEDVKRAYLLAYDLGCKGITVYRDQSRTDQVLNVGVSEKEKGGQQAEAEKATIRVDVPRGAPAPATLKPRPRPDVVTGRTQKIMTGYGAIYVTINEDAQGLFEVFAQAGRGGGYTASFTEGLARLVSLCLRSGIPVDEVIDQLEGIRSPRIAYDHGEHVLSIPDAVAKALKRHIGAQSVGVQKPVESFEEPGSVETDSEQDKEVADDQAIVRAGLNPECPECGRVLVFEEGCVRCHSCGYSEC